MIHRWNTPPLRIAGIYFVISLAYIVGSDWLVEADDWRNWLPGVQTSKGIAFVVLSALLIHYLIARELRRRQALERQLMRAQRMESVGQLTGGVAHDFNNFLTVILGNLELIHDDAGCNSAMRDRADHALLATERGADLTRRLLAFSREQSLEPRLVNVNECVAQMNMLLGCVLGEGIVVKVDLAKDLPPIMADPGQLETGILNLALNARDAMPNGGTILLTTRAESIKADQTTGKWSVAKGSYVRISVEDNGLGMSQRVQDRIVDPFFTTKPAGQGTGLGFPMAHGFVKQSGGHVVVRSEIGRGTTVSLYFPTSEQQFQSSAEHPATAPDRGGDETLLLVENDPDVRSILNDHLTHLGYRVHLAARADEAQDLLAGGVEIDLLMADIILGGRRCGIELANEVRQSHPNVPVLVISGFADSTVATKLSDPARSAWLAKPFNRQTVARRVRELLDECA